MKAIQKTEQRTSLVEKFANKYSLDPGKMMTTLKATAFRQKGRQPIEITNEQMAALIVVADQYGLNPFTKEIYAYPDQGSIVPVVGVDGWARIINEHPANDGIEFRYSDDMIESAEHRPCPSWCEVVVNRKDRSHPTIVREYFDEVYRPPFGSGRGGPWQSHTKRMLRHKTLIQGARIAFGFVGVFDQDEADRIIEAEYHPVDIPQPESATKTEEIKAKLGIVPDPIVDEIEPESVEGEVLEPEKELEVDPETGEVLPPHLQG